MKKSSSKIILSNSNQCVPYNKVLQADAALAKKSLMEMDPITGAVPPENLVPVRHIQFGKDNLDARK